MSEQKNITIAQSKITALQEEIKRLREENAALKAAQVPAKQSGSSQKNQESQSRYLGVFENSLLGNKIISADLKIMQVNQAMVELLGLESKQDLIGRHIIEFAHPDFKEDWQLLQKKLWEHKVPSFSIETCLYRRDGSIIWVNVTSILFLENGELLGYTLIENIQNRKEAVDRLRVSEKQFLSMTDMIPNQVWTTTPNGRISYVNQQVCDYFGCDAREMVGHGRRNFIHPEDLSKVIEAWERALRSEGEYTAELRFKNKDGLYKWHLCRAVPIITKGVITLWLGTSTNIDTQKNNEHKKDEFLNIASHELKTPLTTIKAYNQIIKRSDDPAKIMALAGKLTTPIEQLERLITDLLDVNMINSGQLVYNVEKFDFQDALQQSIEAAGHLSARHRIILERSVQVFVKGDKFRLEQVLHHFLTNAIKYSPAADRVIVNQEVLSGNLIVSVQDFGIGIAAQDLAHIFDRYYRADHTAMYFSGLGLGLFISAEIIKRYQGKVWIDSEPGQGTTVYFSLPL